LKVVNALGEVVYQSTISNTTDGRTGQQSTIDISKYAKGIYFVRITDENKNVVNRKIVIQ